MRDITIKFHLHQAFDIWALLQNVDKVQGPVPCWHYQDDSEATYKSLKELAQKAPDKDFIVSVYVLDRPEYAIGWIFPHQVEDGFSEGPSGITLDMVGDGLSDADYAKGADAIKEIWSQALTDAGLDFESITYSDVGIVTAA